MSEISKLNPVIVWENFDRITQVPRPSKKEGRILEFLKNFATANGLEHASDKAGNIVIRRPASASMCDRPTVVLQSHVDMVCEKNSDTTFNFDNDPIKTYVDNGWVKARGTTLGADDGIGMAAALAALTDTSAEYPAIEALFTVDEETGLTGALNLGAKMITGKYLINLDSEDEGEIFIGCAGGIDTIATFRYAPEIAPEKHVFYKINVLGLQGGHSGEDIDKNRGNANKILAALLLKASQKCGIRLVNLDGGNLRNAIPREASAVFAVPVDKVLRLFDLLEEYDETLMHEYSAREPKLDTMVSEVSAESHVMDPKTQNNLLEALVNVPNGVLAMSNTMKGLVQTSTNLASVKFHDDNTILVSTSQRSSVESERFEAAASVASVFELAGATVKHSEGYPGWEPNPHSKLLEVATQTYENLFGTKPHARAIHAGLECGLFLQKYPHLEMISVGPTLRGVHSPDESLEIASVDKFWKLLKGILQNIRE